MQGTNCKALNYYSFLFSLGLKTYFSRRNFFRQRQEKIIFSRYFEMGFTREKGVVFTKEAFLKVYSTTWISSLTACQYLQLRVAAAPKENSGMLKEPKKNIQGVIKLWIVLYCAVLHSYLVWYCTTLHSADNTRWIKTVFNAGCVSTEDQIGCGSFWINEGLAVSVLFGALLSWNITVTGS